MRLSIGAFGIKIWRRWYLYAFRTPRIVPEHDQCFPNRHFGVRKACGKACEKSSGYSSSIRCVRKAFGKHTESIRKGNLSKSICGKYLVYSEIILKTFGKETESIRWYSTIIMARTPRLIPNASRFLSVYFSVLSEYTEYFPHIYFERFPLRTLFVCFPNAFRTRQIELE